MKKLLLSSLFVITTLFSTAQGLEGIIVEKYYISDANDATVNSIGGVLPVGSVTYRVYVDMQPDYIFQAVYGDANHELRIETTTLFFNNEDRGATFPTFSKNFCDDNTVMLDSWLSVGAACASNYGVLKADDDGVATVVNNDGVLQNNDPAIGIPLTQEDGFITGAPEPVTAVGINNEIQMFDAQNDGTNGPLFSTNNGSWASLNGSMGADPFTNHVLIAQITTDGDFSFELNIQIRNNLTSVVENYVASNPVGSEILEPTLTYISTSGINDQNEKSFSFNVYPVPANDVLWLEIKNPESSKAVCKVYDLLGKVVVQEKFSSIVNNSKQSIALNTLNSGIYFVEVEVAGEKFTRKIIKQ